MNQVGRTKMPGIDRRAQLSFGSNLTSEPILGHSLGSPMKPTRPQESNEASMKWGYAFAGACAIGFAALIQVAFGGLDEEALANLPALVTVPYGIAGKLGITVPLAMLGVGLILRDVLVNQRGNPSGTAPAPARRTKLPGVPGLKHETARGSAEDLEVGEPLADELPPAPLQSPAKKPTRKIAALPASFGGRRDGAAETTGGVLGDAPVPQRPGTGQIVLSSAQYLNRNPGGSFRRGTTQHSSDE